jgi:hypothetical protein
VRTALAQRLYTEPAIPPAFTWLDAKPPAKPQLATRSEAALKTTIQWAPSDREKAWLWVLQTRQGKDWTTEIIPGAFNARTFTRDKTPGLISLIAIDRCGNASPPASIRIGEAGASQAAR